MDKKKLIVQTIYEMWAVMFFLYIIGANVCGTNVDGFTGVDVTIERRNRRLKEGKHFGGGPGV